jgi:hypothetical protein
MKRSFETPTLQLSRPSGYTLGLTLLILLTFVLLCEVLFRSEAIQNTLASPSIGSDHRNFEEQVNQLWTYASDDGLIDCVFVGDSTVQTDFYPIVFEKAYGEQAGEEIDCFNFGVGASNVVSLATFLRIIANDLKPRLIIFGIHALDFTVPPEADEVAIVLEMPWIRYKLGEFSPVGWLYEHSQIVRYSEILRQIIRIKGNRESILHNEEDELLKGFYSMEGQGLFDLANPPDPESKHPYDEHYFAELGNFKLLPVNLEALDQIADLQSATTTVMAVEMPVSDTYYYYFENDEEEYNVFKEEIRSRLSAKSVPFFETTHHIYFADKEWFNRNHLNLEGAQIFSAWLGEEIGDAVKMGTVRLSSARDDMSQSGKWK